MLDNEMVLKLGSGEALEASVAAHPASGRHEQGRPDTGHRPGGGAKVLRLVPRPTTSPDPEAA